MGVPVERVRILSSGTHWLAAQTELLRWNGRLVARKRYRTSHPIARMLLNHEASVLKALHGLEGIPRLLEHRPGRHFTVEYREGKHVSECPRERLTLQVYERMVDLVRRMHARRVVHLDLRQRRNVLIGSDGAPIIVDFQSSIRFPENGIFNPLFEICRWVDRSALIRWKNRYFRSLMTAADKAFARIHSLLRPIWFVSPFKRRAADRL